jgi:hypothetical protein
MRNWCLLAGSMQCAENFLTADGASQIRNLSLQIVGLRFEALAILGVGFIQIESV